jgi:hypothetical protein
MRKRNTQELVPDKYLLVASYKPEFPAQRYQSVYIPPALAEALASPDLDSFNMVTLKLTAASTRVLANHSQHVVVGVRSRKGEEISEIPAAWRRLRRRNSVAGWVLLTAAFTTSVVHHNVWIAAFGPVLAIAGTRLLLAARSITVKPFWVDAIWSR